MNRLLSNKIKGQVSAAAAVAFFVPESSSVWVSVPGFPSKSLPRLPDSDKISVHRSRVALAGAKRRLVIIIWVQISILGANFFRSPVMSLLTQLLQTTLPATKFSRLQPPCYNHTVLHCGVILSIKQELQVSSNQFSVHMNFYFSWYEIKQANDLWWSQLGMACNRVSELW